MHSAILRRCGWVLVAIGALDLAHMVWCVVHRQSYRSSLVFALPAGVLLVRGSLRAARLLALVAAFVLAMSVTALAAAPLARPAGYWVAVLRHGAGLGGAVVLVAWVGVVAWVLRQLLRPEVRRAQEGAGLAPPRVRTALAIGVAVPLIAAAAASALSRGAEAREAIRRAEAQRGGAYRYVLTGMKVRSSSGGTTVTATVAAYNESELENVQVSWTR
jgi:hypothetical protein